jgi:hypothetical protein
MSKSSAKQRINQIMEWRKTLKIQRVKPKPIDDNVVPRRDISNLDY